MSRTLEEIISIEGIVIRKIPKLKVTFHALMGRDPKSETGSIVNSELPLRLTATEGDRIVVTGKGKLLRRVTTNALAGYIITEALHQDTTIIFNKHRDGVGKTVPEAFADFEQKRGRAS